LKYIASAANPATAPSRRIRVLIALDDPAYGVRLTTILPAREYEVEEASCSETLLDAVRRRACDLIVLGIKTRGTAQSIEACRRVRELAPRSGIVLVSTKDLDDGAGDRRADGLEAGADDYITASVESREFLARIRAVLRRIQPAESSGRLMRAGDLEIDIDRRYFRRNGEPVHLTRREFDLLSVLMQKPGTSFTHAQLLRSVWGPDYGSELEYLRAYIRLLRRKIDVDPARPSYIRTVPGVGYYFQSPLDL
jgi:two-component system KDP operon response regulator KdpE